MVLYEMVIAMTDRAAESSECKIELLKLSRGRGRGRAEPTLLPPVLLPMLSMLLFFSAGSAAMLPWVRAGAKCRQGRWLMYIYVYSSAYFVNNMARIRALYFGIYRHYGGQGSRVSLLGYLAVPWPCQEATRHVGPICNNRDFFGRGWEGWEVRRLSKYDSAEISTTKTPVSDHPTLEMARGKVPPRLSVEPM